MESETGRRGRGEFSCASPQGSSRCEPSNRKSSTGSLRRIHSTFLPPCCTAHISSFLLFLNLKIEEIGVGIGEMECKLLSDFLLGYLYMECGVEASCLFFILSFFLHFFGAATCIIGI